ncbi:hypothetical protein HYPSUDRAFT_46089 [Hypholoma sublateritium FD-334 SS-4]|uniref:Uncharacterized protein n=1 Tax=Hypholoma sublateritium (strain FD-334 SS-4) TaxID=945553 RepID=A0A0D2PBU8_HYPSF|nr:hypothetical protein HYPSUDRAFT_46089 [Hypholoma sublateritium FD-334 SS-4]
MSSPSPAAKPKAGTKWVSRMGIPVRSPSLLGRQQSTAPEKDTPLSKTLTRDTTATASPPPTADATSSKSGPKWASKLGAAAKRTPSVVNLSRPTAASAAKERDSDTASIQTTASRDSVAISSRPSTPSTEPNGKGPKWASKLGAAARRSPSMLSLARPTAASAAKESDAVPVPARKSISPTPKSTSPPEASRKPATPSSGKATKAPSPPPAPMKAVKASKPVPPPSPAPPADAAGAKPKTKWTSRVGGAVRRSSSLLSTARPVTAAKEEAVPQTPPPSYKARDAVPAVLRAPSALAHEVDVLADSPTEEVEASTTHVDESTDDLILDQARAASPLQDVERPSESAAVDDTPEPRAPEPFVAEADASERPESPFADSVSQELVEEPSSMSIEDAEHERPVSPFADETSPEIAEPVAEPAESDSSSHEQLVSPFADVDSSEYAEEAPVEPLVIDAIVHERSTSPLADAALSNYVEEPKAIVAEPLTPVVEEPAERSASPFEDSIHPAEDLSPVIDAHTTEPAAQLAQERATSPFDDAASVEADVHSTTDIAIDVAALAPEAATADLHPAASTPPALAPAILPDPTFSGVLVEEPLSDSAHISTESDKVGAEQPALSPDEDPFADPPLTQRNADEPWTIVDSQVVVEHATENSARDKLVAEAHEYGLSGTNPWAASEPVEHKGADAPELVHVRVDERHAIEVANALVIAAQSETVAPAGIVHPPTVDLTSAIAVAAPVVVTQPVVSAEPASSPATPAPSVLPGVPSRATLTPPTLSTITTPLRALRAPTLPPPAAHSDTKLLGNVWAAASAVLYHPLAQEESDESASPARAAGAGVGAGASGYGGVARSRDVSTDSGARAQAAGRYACMWHGRPWAWFAHVLPSGLSRAPGGPSAPKRTPRADPYPPRPQSGAGSRPAGTGEENTTWNSVYEVIVGVISEIVTMSMRIIWRK